MAKMERKQFVETVLAEAIKAACPEVERLEYVEQFESVNIIFDDGWHLSVNVACDSHLAIIQDVTRRLC